MKDKVKNYTFAEGQGLLFHSQLQLAGHVTFTCDYNAPGMWARFDRPCTLYTDPEYLQNGNLKLAGNNTIMLLHACIHLYSCMTVFTCSCSWCAHAINTSDKLIYVAPSPSSCKHACSVEYLLLKAMHARLYRWIAIIIVVAVFNLPWISIVVNMHACMIMQVLSWWHVGRCWVEIA